MADQSVSVSGPVSTQSDSVYRVAGELAQAIHRSRSKDEKTDREYWLTLYGQCRSVVVHGNDPKRVLAAK